MEKLRQVRDACGLRILFAQKSFASYAVYPIIADALNGVCASGLWEARLGHTKFDGEVHTYSPAYRDDEMAEIFSLSHTVVFNSATQLRHFTPVIAQYRPKTQVGIRINPECSVTDTPLYDPCTPYSRLGIRQSNIGDVDFSMVDGLHFHALCEQTSYALEKVLLAVERNFASQLAVVKWLNMGGGHFITQPEYNTDHLISIIRAFQERHPHLQLYMEPGGAVVLNAGRLVTTVLDILPGSPKNVILDISCTCHTPDVLEMPYRPAIEGEVPVRETPHTYRIGGVSCLAGDVFGEYGFSQPLARGDKLSFLDMAQYSIVKTTMFNGVRHPAIAVYDSTTENLEIVRQFSFTDFVNRL
ncbi:MAG: carboxynorspermidine decarboxylase [Deltaproteobacteria bacterium]|nr:carboxynorspermidine decarboxylase [Deltaproteobacteria bacterium]MBN2673613.1 carboxynorspermidine decarboxylase [Deltaproteobacteria bacterium]